MTATDRPGEVPPLSSVDTSLVGGAPGRVRLDGNGPVRAFERTGTCVRCGWFGGLDDDLCILCFNDPALTDEPATIVDTAWLERVVMQCALCGVDIDRPGELCHRCFKEA